MKTWCDRGSRDSRYDSKIKMIVFQRTEDVMGIFFPLLICCDRGNAVAVLERKGENEENFFYINIISYFQIKWSH